MKLIRRQKIWLAIIIIANLTAWIIPSDVVENIARDRHTLLGRYSRGHFTAILGLFVFSLVSFYVDWSIGAVYRKRWFQVIATLVTLVPALLLIDFVLRSPQSTHYVRDHLAYHRPPDFSISVTFEDHPQAARSYPNPRPGFESIQCELRTDGRGFRNAETLERADVVTLGDSFTEGSSVSDEHAWPVRLAAMTGMEVYNLGMSGYAPIHYLASLKRYGLALKPRFVVCCLYEGNDFRSAKSDRKGQKPSVSKRLNRYFKQSPLVGRMDRWLIDALGPIRADAPIAGAKAVAWLPLALPSGPDARFYAFAPKQLRDLYGRKEAFALHKHWLNPRKQLEEMRRLCTEAGAELILLYAPLKAHVVMPATVGLPAGDVREFLALRYKKALPEPDEFMSTLMQRIGGREAVVADWCEREGIAFLSTTKPLRLAAIESRQTYFTYDQHWTPIGHDVVARIVADHLASRVSAGATRKPQ